MNVYDFDNTIYDGDSTLDFYQYCLIHHPSIIICFPKQLLSFIKYKLKIIDKECFKECFYIFLNRLDNVEEDVNSFWKIKIKNIKTWYLNQKKQDDIIISASPYFLLIEACNTLGINNLIASQVDKKTGKLLKPNCYGEKKVSFFKERFDISKVDIFYSDSISDKHMAYLSKKAYLVKGDKFEIWPF